MPYSMIGDTRDKVPRGDRQGRIGAPDKRFEEGHFINLFLGVSGVELNTLLAQTIADAASIAEQAIGDANGLVEQAINNANALVSNAIQQMAAVKGAVVLTTSGNYTVPAGANKLKVTCIGGGSANNGATGGSGGGMATVLLTVSPGQAIPYVVGAGGASSGAAGGSTSFGSYVQVSGGGGSSARYGGSLLSLGPSAVLLNHVVGSVGANESYLSGGRFVQTTGQTASGGAPGGGGAADVYWGDSEVGICSPSITPDNASATIYGAGGGRRTSGPAVYSGYQGCIIIEW